MMNKEQSLTGAFNDLPSALMDKDGYPTDEWCSVYRKVHTG